MTNENTELPIIERRFTSLGRDMVQINGRLYYALKSVVEKGEAYMLADDYNSERPFIETRTRFQTKDLGTDTQQKTVSFNQKLLALYELHDSLLSNIGGSKLEIEGKCFDCIVVTERKGSIRFRAKVVYFADGVPIAYGHNRYGEQQVYRGTEEDKEAINWVYDYIDDEYQFHLIDQPRQREQIEANIRSIPKDKWIETRVQVQPEWTQYWFRKEGRRLLAMYLGKKVYDMSYEEEDKIWDQLCETNDPQKTQEILDKYR